MTNEEFAALQAACGLISEGGAGTGYLVGPRTVITCHHVAKKDQVTVEFDELVRQARVIARDTTCDAAVLELTEPVGDIKPLVIGGRVLIKAPWDSWGYPTIAKGAALPMDGVIKSPLQKDDQKAPVMVLSSPELAAGMAAPASGFSGSPVLVDGRVIGHLKRVVKDPSDPAAARPAFGLVYATLARDVLVLQGVRPEDRDPVVGHLRESARQRNQLDDVPTAVETLERVESVSRTRVLWVDDNPDNNIEEYLMLRALGLTITQATSNTAADRYRARLAFDLVITDLGRGSDRNLSLIHI